MAHFTITHDTTRQLETRKEEIERAMAKLREEHDLIKRKLEAIPLFLAELNGHRTDTEMTVAPPTSSAPPEAPSGMSLPMAVKAVLQKHGRMTAVEVRQAVLQDGFPRERLGAAFSYLYTVLGRLEQRGQVQRNRGKYQLPPGVTFQFGPEDADLKP